MPSEEVTRIATTDPDVPQAVAVHGLRIDPIGTHLSRTIMLKDLRVLLARRPAPHTADNYRVAVVEENALAKKTASARRISFNRLRELYALDPDILLFRALRDLWDADALAQPMIALLCATARDPILRAITPFVLGLPVDTPISAKAISEEAEREFPGKFKPKVVDALGRNAASSWEQAGLLRGHRNKVRAKPESRVPAVAYALLLGDLCGKRGGALFRTLWARILDTPPHILQQQAATASQQGWLEYRAAGDVIEISFRHLMRDEARARR